MALEKNTLIAKQKVMMEETYSKKKVSMMVGFEKVKTLKSEVEYHFTFKRMVISMTEILRNAKLFRNQATQCSHVGRPIIFIAS